jgi:hypothetical protein
LLARRPPEIPWLTTQIISVRAPSEQTLRHGPPALPRGRGTRVQAPRWRRRFTRALRVTALYFAPKKAQQARQLRTSAPLAKNA